MRYFKNLNALFTLIIICFSVVEGKATVARKYLNPCTGECCQLTQRGVENVCSMHKYVVTQQCITKLSYQNGDIYQERKGKNWYGIDYYCCTPKIPTASCTTPGQPKTCDQFFGPCLEQATANEKSIFRVEVQTICEIIIK